MNKMALFDPYVDSVLVERLLGRDHPCLTVLDLDGTNDGDETVREEVDMLARKSGGLIYASARTEELMMTDTEYALSVERHGFTRPRALKSVELHYKNQTDPDAMCPFGGIPHLRQKAGGFASDSEYAQLRGMDNWYWEVRRALAPLDTDLKIHSALAPIEDIRNFQNGTADVTPLPFRIQLDFLGLDGFENMMDVLRRITSSMVLTGLPRNVRFFDESNPANERYTLYLVPRHAAKGHSVDRVVRKSATTANIFHKDLAVSVAGDTFTDMSMLTMLPGVGDFRFLLAGGSRLAEHFTPGHEKFGTPFAGNRTAAICKRLEPTVRPGVYLFHMPNGRTRTFVNGSVAHPDLEGAASVKAFLEERH